MSGTPAAAHQPEQLFDMFDRRELADTMAQVEHVGTVGERVKQAKRLFLQLGPASQQQHHFSSHV